MSAIRSWQCLGGPGSLPYRLYDAMRRRLNRRLVTYLAHAALVKNESWVLEGGSGPGYASSVFAAHRKVRLSVAADVDLDALREARRRDPTLPVVVADLRQLPFRSGIFDLVWNNSTLEHLDAPQEALREMGRVTAQGGHLFVGVPYRGGPLGFQSWIRSTPLGVWIGTVFDRAGLVRLLTDQGFRLVSTRTYGVKCFIGALARKPSLTAPSR